MILSNRDFAFLIWLAVVAVAVLSRRGGREAMASVLGALRGKVAFLILIFVAYIAAVVLLAQRLGIWSTGLLKDTIVWFLVPGMALLFGFTRAYEGRRYYRRTLVGVLGLTTAVEFYVNLAAFPLLIELLLLPALVFLGLLSAVAGLKPESRSAKRFVDGLLAIAGLAVLIGTGAYLVDHWASLDKVELALSFALPIWLTIGSLPFIFLFSLYANYENAFVRIDLAAKEDKHARRRAKIALVLSFHVRNRALHAFTGMAPWELSAAKSWGEARRIIAYGRAVVRVQEAKENLAAERLFRYAGVEGTDWTGQQLDQREFKETKHALEMLATFHQAQFKDGRYRGDLIDAVGDLLSSKTLPDPGIVTTVAKNGRSWFAWRRAVTGWCLGIGAAEPPPDQWVYDGHEPPTGFPHDGDGWKRGGFDDEDTDE